MNFCFHEQVVEMQITKPVEPEVVLEEAKKATEIVTKPIKIQNDNKMDVNLVEKTKQSQENVLSTQQAIDETVTITIDGDSLNASPEASNQPTTPTKDEDTPSVAADTTTTIILDEESQENKNNPNDDVTIIITSPSDSVSPPNEPSQSEPDNMVTTPDVVPIEIVEVNDDDTTNAKTNEATTEAQTQIVDLSVSENKIEAVVGNNNTDHSNDVEIVQDVVRSTNNETLSQRVEVEKKSDVTGKEAFWN